MLNGPVWTRKLSSGESFGVERVWSRLWLGGLGRVTRENLKRDVRRAGGKSRTLEPLDVWQRSREREASHTQGQGRASAGGGQPVSTGPPDVSERARGQPRRTPLGALRAERWALAVGRRDVSESLVV